MLQCFITLPDVPTATLMCTSCGCGVELLCLIHAAPASPDLWIPLIARLLLNSPPP